MAFTRRDTAMYTTLTIRLSEADHALIAQAAKREDRSMGSLVRRIVLTSLDHKPAKEARNAREAA